MYESIKHLLRQNKTYVWAALATTAVFLTIFKLIYPYPNMVLDSYYYVLAAISKADVNAWAIGYSWFLRTVGLFSHSALLIVIVQYVCLAFSLLVFFLTVNSVFHFSKVSKWALFAFLFTNPILLYTANLIMADALFISLSVLWISLLLWMVYRPKPYLLWLHAVIIVLVFSVRYNALYYPFVATLALIVGRYTLGQKILGIGLQFLLIGVFIAYTSIRVGQISGQSQFSPFGNWKTANDALYMYGHIYRDHQDPVPAEFTTLDHCVRQGFKTDGKVDDLLDYTSPFYGSIYMFYYTSGLVQYKTLLYGEDTEFVNFNKMARIGPLYGQYGAYLIRKYPLAFLHYFVAPNTMRWLYPPMEVYSSLPPFFLRSDYLGQAAKEWFGVKTLAVSWSAINLRGYLLYPYQSMAMVIHLAFILSVMGFLLLRGIKSLSRPERNALLLLTTLWLCDLVFNLTAAATVMRYQVFPLVIEFSLILWLTEQIYTNKSNNRAQ